MGQKSGGLTQINEATEPEISTLGDSRPHLKVSTNAIGSGAQTHRGEQLYGRNLVMREFDMETQT